MLDPDLAGKIAIAYFLGIFFVLGFLEIKPMTCKGTDLRAIIWVLQICSIFVMLILDIWFINHDLR